MRVGSSLLVVLKVNRKDRHSFGGAPLKKGQTRLTVLLVKAMKETQKGKRVKEARKVKCGNERKMVRASRG